MPTRNTTIEVLRRHARQIFDAALEAVDPEAVIFRHVSLSGDLLLVGDEQVELNAYERILVVGAGKATAPMARAIESILGDRISQGVIVVKEGHGLPLKHIQVIEGGHPVPNEQGVGGTEAILNVVEGAARNDLVLCFISGGGSALMVAPVDPISLADKQETTKLLLACGANIHEINAVRKHLSRAKGGQLAQAADPATMITLILSDVVGDDLDVIASGPTVPDTSTFSDAMRILKTYEIWEAVPGTVREYIQQGLEGLATETPKEDNEVFERCDWLLVGNNLQALQAAALQAKQTGYQSLILSSKVEGEAREVAKAFASLAKEVVASQIPIAPPACILCGGETTVTLRGGGLGGRNQEFALAAAIAVEGLENTVILCGGTDGTDGPTDAAGAIVDGATMEAARLQGIDPIDHLHRNDSYRFFQPLNDLIITGPTRTNVMDVYMILVGKPA